MQPLFPIVWEAFRDYRLASMALSGLEIGVLQRLVARPRPEGRTFWTEDDFTAAQDETWRTLARSRERDECRAKLKNLGLLPPQPS